MFVVRIVLVLYFILRRQRAGLISIAPLVPGKGDSPPDLRVSSSKFCSCRNYLLQGQLTFAFFYNYYIHLNSCCNFCFTNAKVTLTTSKLSHALPSPYPPPHHNLCYHYISSPYPPPHHYLCYQVIMCLHCGDPFSIEKVLGPLHLLSIYYYYL